MKRNTVQRGLTLEAVRKLQNHPTADEIYETVSAEHPAISRGTIYRNLSQLAENGDIADLKMPGGADHYDHCPTPHYHVQCVKCSRVFDVDMEYMPNLADAIKDTKGFEILGHQLIFSGICPDCAKKPEDGAASGEDAASI